MEAERGVLQQCSNESVHVSHCLVVLRSKAHRIAYFANQLGCPQPAYLLMYLRTRRECVVFYSEPEYCLVRRERDFPTIQACVFSLYFKINSVFAESDSNCDIPCPRTIARKISSWYILLQKVVPHGITGHTAGFNRLRRCSQQTWF